MFTFLTHTHTQTCQKACEEHESGAGKIVKKALVDQVIEKNGNQGMMGTQVCTIHCRLTWMGWIEFAATWVIDRHYYNINI